jgi:hypothetical protein
MKGLNFKQLINFSMRCGCCGKKKLRYYSRNNNVLNRVGTALKGYDVVMYEINLGVYKTH